MRARFEKVQESFGRICARAQEALWAARTVRAYTQETAEIEAFRHVSWRYVSDNVRRARLSSLLYPLLQFFIGFSFIAVLWYGGDLTAGRNLSIGQFFEFILYLGYLAWPMHILGWELTVLQRGMVSMARVESVLSLRPAIQDSAIPVAVGEIRGSLEFRNVTFRYKGADRPAIDGISFQINPGETVGLVGAVGSGKSTLMNLVPRLLEPCSGDILMDGHSVRQIPLKVLRERLKKKLSRPQPMQP
jgi:ATP-binding cassette subfamily B protein